MLTGSCIHTSLARKPDSRCEIPVSRRSPTLIPKPCNLLAGFPEKFMESGPEILHFGDRLRLGRETKVPTRGKTSAWPQHNLAGIDSALKICLRCRFLIPASPIRPEPSSQTAAGMGTAETFTVPFTAGPYISAFVIVL